MAGKSDFVSSASVDLRAVFLAQAGNFRPDAAPAVRDLRHGFLLVLLQVVETHLGIPGGLSWRAAGEFSADNDRNLG